MIRRIFPNISRYCGISNSIGHTALGGALLASVLVANPAHAANGFVFAANCANCQTSAQFVSAAVSAAQVQLLPGTYIVTSVPYPATAYVKVAGTLCFTPLPNMHAYLCNITTTLVDASGNSLAGQSEATLEATFAAIDLMFFGNIRKSGAINGVIKIPPTYGITPIGNEAWEVDTSNGIQNALWFTLGIDGGNVPPLTVVSVAWKDGTTAQFIRTNSVPTLLWKYVPNSMKDKDGTPITPIAGTTIQNPNTGGKGGGIVIPTVPTPYYLYFQASQYCTATTTLDDGSGTVYQYVYYVTC
jgi:hypothetical protein